MTRVAEVLIAWVVLSIPAALMLGGAIALGSRGRRRDD